MEEIFVINDEITVEKPIDEYFKELEQRLQGMKRQLGEDTGALPVNTNLEKFNSHVDHAAMSSVLQRNVREYYNELKLLRADSQIYYPVPHEVYRDEWDDVPVLDPMEFTHARYTPVVTEDARDFGIDGYTLRLQRMDRRIKLLICVTLYNEDQDTVHKTMAGICDCLEVIYEKFVDGDGNKSLDWTEVACIIIQDGLKNAAEDFIASSTVQGFFSPVVIQSEVMSTPTALHLFEYTARYKKHAGIENYPPLQVIFATKGKNKGKLDSHCWFFDAFAYLIQPDYCVLFDAGTRPRPSALMDIVSHFQRYPNVGALTGELTVERPYKSFLTSVQFCEWKVSHLLQKPVESLCGFLTVLPGAFSAFRWVAVEGEPLRRYFYGLYSQAELNAFEANMFLAEDRILCLEVVAKKGCQYRLEYIKEAVAEADAVTKLTGLMKQRRRWLNGTFFALLYALGNFSRVWSESGHTVVRKIFLSLEFLYLTLNMIVGTWFGIGIFFTMLNMLIDVAFSGAPWLQQIGNVIQLMYLFLIIVQLVMNLKTKPEAVEKVHAFCAIYFCLYMLVFTGVSIAFLVTNRDFSFIGISSQKLGLLVTTLMSAIVGILLTALLHGEILAILGSGFQYWLMVPVFFNILQMHAFANADDISWGTKNLDTKRADHEAMKMASKALAYKVRPTRTSQAFWEAMDKMQAHLHDAKAVAAYNAKKEQKLKAFSAYLLIAWVGTNAMFIWLVMMFSSYTWEVCAATESEIAVMAIRSESEDYDKALAIADLVQTAVTMIQRGQQLYPFDGLQGFPEAYPMLVSGDAQSNTARGSRVTVLANATELFTNIDQSMPRFDEWLQESMGINASSTLGEWKKINMPLPGNTTYYDTTITCVEHYGYQYYLQIQFLILLVIVFFQVGGSIVFIFAHYFRKWSGKAFGTASMDRSSPEFGTGSGGKYVDGESEVADSEFEIAIQQPGSARYLSSSHRPIVMHVATGHPASETDGTTLTEKSLTAVTSDMGTTTAPGTEVDARSLGGTTAYATTIGMDNMSEYTEETESQVDEGRGRPRGARSPRYID